MDAAGYIEKTESPCRSVFVNAMNENELQKAFNDLWIRLINEKENSLSKNIVLHADIHDL